MSSSSSDWASSHSSESFIPPSSEDSSASSQFSFESFSFSHSSLSDSLSSTPESSSSSAQSSSSTSGRGDTFQAQHTTTEYPSVPPEQNGTGETYQKEQFFNTFGKLLWEKDPRGIYTAYSHDLATGAITQRIDDANVAALPGTMALRALAESSDSPQHLVTDFQTDALGRTLKELGPPHEIQLKDCDTQPTVVRTVRFNVYMDDVFEERTCMGYATGNAPTYDYVTMGPVQISRRDSGGRTIDQITARRCCENGALSSAEIFPRKNWTKWTHNDYDTWGRLRSTRVYFEIPDDGNGIKNEHYDETRYDYDIMGRKCTVVSPGGTIAWTVYNTLGWVIEHWMGTNDAGATESDPSGGGTPGNNMVRTAVMEYDHGVPGGNGLLTKWTTYVGSAPNPSLDRVTEHTYDERDRLKQTKTSDGTTDFYEVRAYDNLDRLISVTGYHDSVTEANRMSYKTTQYDNMGRVFKEYTYAVDPFTGALGNPLVSERWYDPNGNVIKQIDPGRQAYQKYVYDGLGRLVIQYLAYPGPGESSSSSSEEPGSESSSSTSSLTSESSSSSSSPSSSSSSESSSSHSSHSSIRPSSSHSSPSSSSSSSSSSDSSTSSSSSPSSRSSSSFVPSSHSSPSSSSSSSSSSTSSSSFSHVSSASSATDSSVHPTSSSIPGDSGVGSSGCYCDCACQESGEGCEEDADDNQGQLDPNSENTSSDPVRYASGQLVYAETDLSSNGFGLPWGHTRSYGNLLLGTGVNGKQWAVWQFSRLLFNVGYTGDNIAVFRGATSNLWFAPDGSEGYLGRFAIRYQLARDTVNHTFVLTSRTGMQQIFNDETVTPESMRGRLVKVIDRFGNVTDVSYNELQQAISFVRSAEGASSGFYYSYVEDGENIGMLLSARLMVNGQDVRRATYEYYADGDGGGLTNDLKRVTIEQFMPETQSWNVVRRTFYRYYIGWAVSGFPHGLKYLLNSNSYEQMTAAGLDPENATDEQMGVYADLFVMYDDHQRVVEEKLRGGEKVVTFTYELNPTGPAPGTVNVWNTKTVETRADGSKKTVYTNKSAWTILRITQKPGHVEKNYAYFQYNEAGRVTLGVSSEAIHSVDEPSPGDPTLTVNLKANTGLIKQTDYYAHTDPSSGAVDTYLMSRSTKRGGSGTAKILHQVGYTTHSAVGVTIHPISFKAEFPNSGLPLEDAPTTSFNQLYY